MTADATTRHPNNPKSLHNSSCSRTCSIGIPVNKCKSNIIATRISLKKAPAEEEPQQVPTPSPSDSPLASSVPRSEQSPGLESARMFLLTMDLRLKNYRFVLQTCPIGPINQDPKLRFGEKKNSSTKCNRLAWREAEPQRLNFATTHPPADLLRDKPSSISIPAYALLSPRARLSLAVGD